VGSNGLPSLASASINLGKPIGMRRAASVEEGMSKKPVLGGIIATAALFIASLHGEATAANQPPNCAAIAFRPMISRSGDGQQDAGLYKSRFGRIEVKATVKNGQPQNYFVEINGKPLTPAPGVLPDALAACAKAKRLTAPSTPEPQCIGDQVTVLIDHSGDDRYVLLYVHRAGTWRFCSAGIA
jgi:hypothetical protein